MNYEQAFFFIRKPRTIQRICIIKAMQSFSGLKNWYKSTACKESVHYLISQDGQILQMVKDEDVAIKSRESNINDVSIFIEIEIGDNDFTDKQYRELSLLLMELHERHGIPLAETHISIEGFKSNEFRLEALLNYINPPKINKPEVVEILNQDALEDQKTLNSIKKSMFGIFQDDSRTVGVFLIDKQLKIKLGYNKSVINVNSTDIYEINEKIKKYQDQTDKIANLESEISDLKEILVSQAKSLKRLSIIREAINFLFKKRK